MVDDFFYHTEPCLNLFVFLPTWYFSYRGCYIGLDLHEIISTGICPVTPMVPEAIKLCGTGIFPFFRSCSTRKQLQEKGFGV